MTAKSKTAKTRNTVLGSRNPAATKPKKARGCGYFDCPGCDACRHVPGGTEVSTARGCNLEKDGAPGVGTVPAAGNTYGVSEPGHQTFPQQPPMEK